MTIAKNPCVLLRVAVRSRSLQALLSGRNWADPPLSALGPNWCQTWCQNQAIFPVFSGFADFLALCRQQLAYFPVPWHGRGRRFDPDQVHQISYSDYDTQKCGIAGVDWNRPDNGSSSVDVCLQRRRCPTGSASCCDPALVVHLCVCLLLRGCILLRVL